MHGITIFNLGNADCIRITLANGRRALFDYADMCDPDDRNCELARELRDDLGDRHHFDVVAFTHLDRDHYAGATDFFYFEHIKEYQGDVDGEPRIRMNVMWVPAAVITEALGRDADVEAKAIQREARERFREKRGIRVFSRPARLKEWCEQNGVDFEERRTLVSDAGTIAPEFTLGGDGVEFFVHSPFAVRQDECTVVDRNNDALAMHATFEVGGKSTRLFLTSDIGHECLSDIVRVTESKGKYARLQWEIFKLPHHCSHHSLSAKSREGDKSEPEPLVARLFEHYGQQGCVVVSTSKPIPEKGSDEDCEGACPPHRQAANYYIEDVVESRDDFKVTMEHPNAYKPSPLEIQIDHLGVTVKQVRQAGIAVAAASHAPRAG